MIRAATVLVFLAFSASVSVRAETLVGKVVGVSDGDTITVLAPTHERYKVRLAGIDAPEKRQAFGERSKQHLSRLVFDRNVTVKWQKRDRYKRIVGKVLVNELDAGLQQVEAGMAWHYKKYQREQSPDDRRSYADAEERARTSGVGLWQDRDSVPPWEWRRSTDNRTRDAQRSQ